MRKIISMGALLLSFALIPTVLPAQSSQPDSQDSNGTMTAKPKAEMTTVTGCVQAGKKEGTFKLIGDDGTTYMLRSKSANLADHVGHTVTVSGRVMTGEMRNGGNGSAAPSNSGDSANSSGADQNAPAADSTMKHGPSHFMVHSLTMVSDSCKTSK